MPSKVLCAGVRVCCYRATVRRRFADFVHATLLCACVEGGIDLEMRRAHI